MKEKLRRKVEKNIHKFDLCALLNLLKSHGFSYQDIYFISNNSTSSPSHLCQEIHFHKTAPSVTITLNMGLLSSGSLIPSYIEQMIDTEEVNSDQMNRFLNFFNHHLMSTFIQLSMPELNNDFFLNWKATQLQYLKLLGFESVSTLWFLMKICFPDLIVEVKKNPQVVRLHTSSLILGRDPLGPTSFLGTRFKQTLSSFKVSFTTDNELSELGIPWPIEINKRFMELIYPILKNSDLHLSVILKIKNKKNYLKLGSKSYLGFDRIGHSSHPFELLIYYGLVKNLRRNKFLPS